jgi:hypothetical protein
LLAVLAWAPAQAQDVCVVRVPRVSNAFIVGEPLRMSVSLTGARRRVEYAVENYRGRMRWQSAIQVGGEQAATLTLPQTVPVGWYRLHLTWDTGTQTTDFCVLPPPYADPGDYSLFALHPNSGAREQDFEAAALMGVRLVRQTVPWPPFEPTRGVWRMDLLDNWYALARKYGMQMTMILGYTPTFLGEKPINYLDDWVSAAAFIWHVKEPNEFGLYLDRVMGFAQGKTVPWPPAVVLPATGAPAQQSLPWADSWEMWNEADMMFYVGNWNRYRDLLHMAWAAGRQRVPGSKMVYGGSTGNWQAMGQVADGSTKYCFDYANLHPGGDMEQALKVWYSGAQQIPWCVGAPRETWHTEAYGQGRQDSVDWMSYQETPAELQRLYLTLKGWDQAAYFRSGCLGGFIFEPGMLASGTSLLVPRAGKLAPTPLYPAFAAARQLLSDAVLIGPVTLRNNPTAYAYLKHGEVMLAAWSDTGGTTTFQLAPGARELDVYNHERNWGARTRLGVTMTSEPTVMLGASDVYLRQGLRQRFTLLSETHYGTPQSQENVGWYVRPLMTELDELLGGRGGSPLKTAVIAAALHAPGDPEGTPAALVAAQDACRKLMLALVGKCRVGEEVPVKVANNIWRLGRIDEWLGQVADDLSGRWSNLQVDPSTQQQALTRLAQLRASHQAVARNAYSPLVAHLLDRVEWQRWRLVQYGRAGAYRAMMDEMDTAELLLGIEKPYVMAVVPLVDFPTGRSFRKARVLEPGQTHTLTLWVYNYLNHPVSGTLRLKLPPTWSPTEVSVSFTAAANAPSEMQPVQVALPAEPTPWLEMWSFTMDGNIRVTLPSTLSDSPMLEVTGELSTGEPLCPMSYYLNVGHWLDDPALPDSMQTAAVKAAGNQGLRLPDGMKQAQMQSVQRELERLSRPAEGTMRAW